MSVSEARLNHAIAYLEKKMSKMIEANNVFYPNDDEFVALSTLHELAMKQVPSPVDVKKLYLGDCPIGARYFCPVCHKEIDKEVERDAISCEGCGQVVYIEEEE